MRQDVWQIFDNLDLVGNGLHTWYGTRDFSCDGFLSLAGDFSGQCDLIRPVLHFDLIGKESRVREQRQFDGQDQRGYGSLPRAIFFLLFSLFSFFVSLRLFCFLVSFYLFSFFVSFCLFSFFVSLRLFSFLVSFYLFSFFVSFPFFSFFFSLLFFSFFVSFRLWLFNRRNLTFLLRRFRFLRNHRNLRRFLRGRGRRFGSRNLSWIGGGLRWCNRRLFSL